jgi:two-component system OmpR family response regulator
MKILVVEDDPSVADALCMGLQSDSHAVDIARDGKDGSFLGRTYDYDTIILDHALPGKDGLTICKDIRGIGKTTPIIFLSVTNDTQTKVQAFEYGADDYMVKPFSLLELQSRIKAVARRTPTVRSTSLKVDDLSLDQNSHSATRGKRRIHLTKKEFTLLEYFMRNQGIVLSRSMIMEHVWTTDNDPFSNTVEAHIRNLRKKINAGSRPNLILNIPSHGYVIDTPEKLKKFNR